MAFHRHQLFTGIPTSWYGPAMSSREATAKSGNARIRLLDVALRVIREKGYHATTVDELCAAAGVTKGAFFHPFKSKEDVAVQDARQWFEVTGALFASAPYHRTRDPMERVLADLDFCRGMGAGEGAECKLLVGT